MIFYIHMLWKKNRSIFEMLADDDSSEDKKYVMSIIDKYKDN